MKITGSEKRSLDRFFWSGGDFEVFAYSIYIQLLVGYLLKRGRKLWALKNVLKLFSELKKSEKVDPTLIFLLSFTMISPKFLLLSIRLGAQKKGLALPIFFKKQVTIAMQWVIGWIRSQGRRVTVEEISDILLWTLEKQGPAWQKWKNYHLLGAESRHLLSKLGFSLFKKTPNKFTCPYKSKYKIKLYFDQLKYLAKLKLKKTKPKKTQIQKSKVISKYNLNLKSKIKVYLK